MRNFKLLIEYDGTRYNGWQRQGNTANTIQGKLADCLSRICGEEIELIGAGRTDAGVHAYCQAANFHTSSELPPDFIKKEINGMLDNDICVKGISEVSPRFHARYNAVSKRYLYRVWNSADINVFMRKYSYHINSPLCVQRMREAAALLIGTHDFKGFSTGKQKKSTVRTVFGIDITESNGMVELEFHGSAFLYNMVRIMTGTLVEIGLGEMNADAARDALLYGNRQKAGHTAPPQGLFLKEVVY